MCAAHELLPAEEIDFFDSLVGKESLSADELKRAQQSLRDCGAIARIEELMNTHVLQAAESLGKLPPGPTLEKLHQLNDFMINRKH